jgi:arginine-tRNA-protein transferase
MARTCCPQYTIRLDSTGFKPDKKHRQVINRFNRYLSTGEKPGEAEKSNVDNGKGKGKGKGKEGSWIDTLRECQTGYGAKDGQKHTFRVSCSIEQGS